MDTKIDSIRWARLAATAVALTVVFASGRNYADPQSSDRRLSRSTPAGAVLDALDHDIETAIEAAGEFQSEGGEPKQVSLLVAELQSAWLANRSAKWTLNCVLLLEHLSADSDAQALLVRMLEDGRPEIRQAALEAAIRCRVVAEPRILPLIATLHHGDPPQRYESARLLGKFGLRATPAAESLVRAAIDETSHVSVRWEAIFALREMGPTGGRALGEIVAVSDRSVAYKALDSLATLGEDAEPAFTSVANGLTNNDPQIRARSATALGALRSRADESLPALRNLLNDPDRQVRVAAQSAIERLEMPDQLRDPRSRFESR